MPPSRTAPSTTLLEDLRRELAEADIMLHRLARSRGDAGAAIALRRALARAAVVVDALADARPAAELQTLVSLRERARELLER